MAAPGFKQDMPPQGGYAPIRWERVVGKKMINGWGALALFVLSSSIGTYKFLKFRWYQRKMTVERFDGMIALQPFLNAEQDRAFCRHLHQLRREETELMKNHPGWEVGTLYGEPIFRTIRDGELPDIKLSDWYAHRPFRDVYEHVWPDMWI